MPVLVAAAVSLLFLAALLFWSGSGIFHREDAAYALTDPSRLMVPEAAPISIEAGRDGAVLFLHGFPSSPAHYRDLCACASDAGFDAFAPLLPGHGGEPEDLLKTNFSQYLAFVRDFYLERRPRYREFHLVGSSMGGAYALALAQEFGSGSPLAPSSLSTIGTPLYLFAPGKGVWSHPLVGLARLLGVFAPSIGAGLPDPAREGQDGDGRWKGYLGLYPRQAYSLMLGLRGIRRRLGLVTCPIYVFHARRDRISGYGNAAAVMRGVGSRLIRHWTANMDAFSHMRHDLLLYDSQRLRVWAELEAFFRECGRDGTGC